MALWLKFNRWTASRIGETDKTDKRCVGTGANERCKVAIQTNSVDVDDCGCIYTADRANTGLHILELTGAARNVANWTGQ